MNVTQQALVTENMNLVYMMIKSFSRRNPRLSDEFESAGFFALTNAANKFDPTFGTQFSTYACNSIRRACINVLRRCNFAITVPNDKEIVKVANASELMLETLQGSEHNSLIDDVLEVVERMNKQRQDIFHSILQGDSMATIGTRIGLSRARIQQIKEEIFDEIRSEIASS